MKIHLKNKLIADEMNESFEDVLESSHQSHLVVMLCEQNLASLNSSADLLAGFKFYGQGVSVVVLSAFGIIGNILAIVTISSMTRYAYSGIPLLESLEFTVLLFELLLLTVSSR